MKNKDPNHEIKSKLQEFPTHKLTQDSQNKIHQELMYMMDNTEKHERRAANMKKWTAGIASVAALGLFIFLGFSTLVSNENATNSSDEQDIIQQQEEDTEQEQQVTPFDKELAREVMQNYKRSFLSLHETSGDDGLVTEFDSNDELHEHFRKVMSEDLTTWMMDTYIKEENGDLYMIAKDSPTWLEEDQDFNIERINNETYNIIQERNNELLGHVNMIFQAIWQDGNWILNDIESETLEQEDKEQQQDEEQEDLEQQQDQEQQNQKEQEEQQDQEAPLEDQAEQVIEALNTRDMESLTEFVHSDKGIVFSPYVHVEEDAVHFQKEQVTNLLDDQETYVWGHYDGRGNPIELTPAAYFEEFLTIDELLNPDEIHVDQFEQRGNTINNIDEVFPEAKVVEFYHAGTEENAGIDWQSLNLVFEQNQQGAWKLTAVVKDQWTV